MKVVRKNLVLTFETENESKLDLVILRPMEGLTGTEIKTAMDTILATGAFGAEAIASKIVGAQYDIRQIEEVTLV